MEASSRCPCGSGLTYGDCCAPLHAGTSTAATATALMRSRYTAFVVGEVAYLLDTWHPSTRPAMLELEEGLQWRGLEIISAVAGGPFDRDGVVEFRARHRSSAGAGELHERSSFVREDGRWLYLTGEISPGRR